MAQGDRREAKAIAGEAMVWLLFFALLFPAGLVGWAIGRATKGGTRTVTVSAAAGAPTTTAAATTAAATTAAATTAAATTATATTTKTPAKPVGSAAGKAVFVASGCGACHTFKPAGSSATVGPDLDTKPALDAKKAKQPLAAFIQESIVKPNAYISPGYPKGVMPTTFGTQLTKKQLADLVSFIAAGK
jgi:mono/diheme cytochrome c family protein